MPSDTTSPAAREALFSLVARLADNKYFLGRHYAEWCSGAPTLESAVAAAAMAQDELGHARALYPLLRTLAPDAGPETEPETRSRFLRFSFLDTPFHGWEDFVAANFLLDGALTTIFAAARDSSYEPLAGRARKVLQEERMHALHGEAWVRRLAAAGGAVRDACEAALRRAWDETLCWFGPTSADDPIASAGILDAGPDMLRSRFLAAIGPTIQAARIALPVRRSGDEWELATPLPWDRWNSSTYRLDGAGEPAAPVSRSSTPETRQQQVPS
jgi:phenylacetate-CoA oxygenase PaaI subunit